MPADEDEEARAGKEAIEEQEYIAIDNPKWILVPSMQCELARQLEYLISDALDDKARHVPAFFAGMLKALEGGIPHHLEHRPADVPSSDWVGLLEFVLWKLSLYLGPRAMARFARELCHPSRFAQLELGTAPG